MNTTGMQYDLSWLPEDVEIIESSLLVEAKSRNMDCDLSGFLDMDDVTDCVNELCDQWFMCSSADNWRAV